MEDMLTEWLEVYGYRCSGEVKKNLEKLLEKFKTIEHEDDYVLHCQYVRKQMWNAVSKLKEDKIC